MTSAELPPISLGPDDDVALVVRIDFSDDAAWQSLRDAADAAAAEFIFPNVEGWATYLDDPAWSGRSVDDVLTALARSDEGPSVVFVADAAGMRGRPTVLAVTCLQEDEDPESYEDEVRFGREFRTTAAQIWPINANLSLANMDFADYSVTARQQPGEVFTGF